MSVATCRRLACHINVTTKSISPVPEAARSKAYVCGRLPAEIVGSNPTVGMDVCCECCQLITRPEESYRLWCVSVWSRKTREWGGHGPLGGGGGFCAKNKQKKSKPISQTRGGAAPGCKEGQFPYKVWVTSCVVSVLYLFPYPLFCR